MTNNTTQNNILRQTYNQATFLSFLRNDFLTDSFDDDNEQLDDEQIRDIKYFESARRIGFDSHLGLTIIEVQHTSHKDTRLGLTKGIQKLMSFYGYEKALVVFWCEGSNVWRLSLVTQEYGLKETVGSGVKAFRKYSNPKRFSFALGEGVIVNTAIEFLVNKGKVTNFEDLLSRFSVETLTTEFYKEIKKQYDDLWDKIKLPNQNPDKDNQDIRKNFALRLTGRLIFCWFLRAKSWIPEDVLSERATTTPTPTGNFYHDTLEALFFDTLNKEQSKRTSLIKDKLNAVPYLNGGLFEAKADDYFDDTKRDYSDKINWQLTVPNSNLTAILNLFEQYHFTIDESTSTDQEIGIDPEMMGRIFENFILDRSATGSFYTPRVIVDYMVDSALKESIDANFEFQSFYFEDFLELAKSDIAVLKKKIAINNREKILVDNKVILPFKISKYNLLKNTNLSYAKGKFEPKDYSHPEVTANIWQLLHNSQFNITHQFFGKSKVIEMNNTKVTLPKLGLIMEIDKQKFALIFSVSFGGYLLLDTIHGTDLKKITKLTKDSPKNLQSFISHIQNTYLTKNTLQESEFIEIWQRDAATPIVTIDRQLRAFSDFCQNYKGIIPDKDIVVKLGHRDADNSGLSFEIIERLLMSAPDKLELTTKNNLVTYLSALRVLDPACGSGAFPMGILQKLTTLIHSLDSTQSIYDIKKTILANCIYGVDIMPIAVEISRLRCWLSLIVDQDHKPQDANDRLPNLEFKFVCANSLVGIKHLDQGLGQDEIELKQAKLMKLRQDTFQPSQNKINLKIQWEKLTAELFELQVDSGFYDAKYSTDLTSWNPFDNQSSPFFDSQWMFGVNSFEIVIGNPPYFVLDSTKNADLNLIEFAKINRSHVLGRVNNIYRHFIALSSEITRQNGIISLITQSSFLCDESANKFRSNFFNELELKELLEFPESSKVFGTATVSTCVFTCVKNQNLDHPINLSFNNYRQNNESIFFQPKLIINKKNLLEITLDGSIPILKDNSELKLISKLSCNKNYFDSYVKIRAGDLDQTLDKVFFEGVKNGVDFVVGKNLDLWKPKSYNLKCNIDGYIEKIKNVKGSDNTLSKYNQFILDIKSPRLAVQGICNMSMKKRLKGCLVEENKVFGNSVNVLSLKNQSPYSILFILALINSSVLNWRFKKTSSNNNINNYEIKQLPIPVLDTPQRQLLATQIEELVEEILRVKESIKTPASYAVTPLNGGILVTSTPSERELSKAITPSKGSNHSGLGVCDTVDNVPHRVAEPLNRGNGGSDTADLESQIDALVYQLYDLTAEEIAIVAG